jgi:hypothetical protein
MGRPGHLDLGARLGGDHSDQHARSANVHPEHAYAHTDSSSRRLEPRASNRDAHQSAYRWQQPSAANRDSGTAYVDARAE